MATILKDAKKLNLRTKFFALHWAMSDKIADFAGSAAEGCYWINSFCNWEYESVGVQKARKISEKYHPGRIQNVHYFQGFTAMMILAEGLSRITGRITGSAVKNALENISNFNTGGLTGTSLGFTKNSHKGARGSRVYQIQNGRFVPVRLVQL